MNIPMIPNYPAIDLHCHFNSGALGDVQPTKNHFRDLPFFQKTYQRLNILASAQTTYPSVMRSDGIYEENLRLREMTQSIDNLFQWVVIDPRQPELFRQATELLTSEKALGIKIHSVCHRYSILEYGGASVANNALEYAVEQVGADRIFFGTNSYAAPFQKGRILLSSISEEDKQKILLQNALRLFPKLSAWLERKNGNK